jgi:hypothetical protein
VRYTLISTACAAAPRSERFDWLFVRRVTAGRIDWYEYEAGTYTPSSGQPGTFTPGSGDDERVTITHGIDDDPNAALDRAYTYDPIGNRTDNTEGSPGTLYYCPEQPEPVHDDRWDQ